MFSYLSRTGLRLAGLLFLASSLPAATGPAIRLVLDATQAPLKILHTQETLPVSPGPLTLYYPKWIPGEHAPDGPIGGFAGLKISAGGKTLAWRRDLLDMFTFHVDVPAGVSSLDIRFDYIEPSGPYGYSGAASATDKMLVVSWNQNVLYPAGHPAQEEIFQASLRLPAGWKFGTALPVESQNGDDIQFKPVALNRLVDSPVIAGQYFRAVDITPPGESIHHEIDMAADSEAALAMPPEVRQEYVNLVEQAGILFGTRHYRDYHFLLSLSNHVAHFGLEHHESNDSRVGERGMVDPKQRPHTGTLLSHEFVHSWCGKFRRPQDLSTPYYEAPEQSDLLWVYEGLTTYLGDLLAERSGLETPEQYREALASTAAEMGPGRPGRTWRPLQDTADGEQISFRGGGGWMNWRRGTDYYPEGELLWLEVDALLRRETSGKRSLTDFCRSFFGGPNNGPELKTYTFEELVSALQAVAPYDWNGFFHERLTSTSPEAPLGGIENGGWKVVYTDAAPANAGGERDRGTIHAEYSLGLALGNDGVVSDSLIGSPAYNAGITSGMKVVAVNSRAFTGDVFRDALKAAQDGSAPLQFLVLNDDYYRTISVDYHGGERYPHLVREEGKPDLLGEIEKPLARP